MTQQVIKDSHMGNGRIRRNHLVAENRCLYWFGVRKNIPLLLPVIAAGIMGCQMASGKKP